MSSTILSTKVLSASQKSLVLNAGLRLVEYNAIQVKYLEYEIPKEEIDAYIFTSQNGVHSFLDNYKRVFGAKMADTSRSQKAFCVGEKTKFLLEKNNFEVIQYASNAEELGACIGKEYAHLKFLWFSGNQRRNELPKSLLSHSIFFKEITAYETSLNYKSIPTTFDGILFFSPTGVRSFSKYNDIKGAAFCIGQTTAQEVKKYTDNYFIANKPTIENVLVQAIKRLKKND